MLPFILDDADNSGIEAGDLIYIEGIRDILLGDGEEVPAKLIKRGKKEEITLRLPALTREERDIILSGCLINFYSK